MLHYFDRMSMAHSLEVGCRSSITSSSSSRPRFRPPEGRRAPGQQGHPAPSGTRSWSRGRSSRRRRSDSSARLPAAGSRLRRMLHLQTGSWLPTSPFARWSIPRFPSARGGGAAGREDEQEPPARVLLLEVWLTERFRARLRPGTDRRDPHTRVLDRLAGSRRGGESPTAGGVIEGQHQRPRAWVIVDNGSSDGTLGLAAELAATRQWIRLVEVAGQPRARRGAPIVRAFLAGLEHLGNPPDVVVKLDADLSMGADYFQLLMREFADDPRLGIASGNCWEMGGANGAPNTRPAITSEALRARIDANASTTSCRSSRGSGGTEWTSSRHRPADGGSEAFPTSCYTTTGRSGSATEPLESGSSKVRWRTSWATARRISSPGRCFARCALRRPRRCSSGTGAPGSGGPRDTTTMPSARSFAGSSAGVSSLDGCARRWVAAKRPASARWPDAVRGSRQQSPG